MDKKSTASSSTQQGPTKKDLTRQHWIEQGSKVLAQSGVEAVRVEPLAKQMGVTKGSFYWHFKNRADLLEAILQDWIATETNSIIEQVDENEGNAIAKLLILFELAIEDDGQVENAIRAWSTNDEKIAELLHQVDQRRINYTRDLFIEVGFTPFEALVRARMIYYFLIGESIVGIGQDGDAFQRNRAERLSEIRLQHSILTHRSLASPPS
jgi:AcrR family transcriptional regulator